MPHSPLPPKVPRPVPAPRARSRIIAGLESELSRLGVSDRAEGRGVGPAATGAARILEDFWMSHPVTPLLEPGEKPEERIVTFLWRDSRAAEVLLFANRITDERNLAASLMQRVPGSDVWHLSYRMSSDWRASYSFHPRYPGDTWAWRDEDQRSIRHALDRGLADPRNTNTIRNRPGTVMSVVALPDAPAQPWVERRAGSLARGLLTDLEGPDARRLWVYEPCTAGPGESRGADDPRGAATGPRPAETVEAKLPLVVVLDGDAWAQQQSIADTLDNLIADAVIRPCIAVLVDSDGREQRWRDLDERGAGGDWLASRLLPWVRARYTVSDDPADVVVAGQSLGGYTALRVALEHPEAVGAVLSQSASLWQRELYATAPELIHRLHAYLEVGAQEWVLLEPNRELAAALAASGADMHLFEYNGGHDYACWRGGLADGLRVLLGAGAARCE